METKWPNILRVVLIPLDKITVINPRTRNRKTFETIVRNIGQIGLKRPITVMPKRGGPIDEFDLVCGQKRAQRQYEADRSLHVA